MTTRFPPAQESRERPNVEGRRGRRSTAAMEADRLTRSLGLALGAEVRRTRRALGLSQERLGARIGVHQTWVSSIESGRGGALSLARWVRIGLVLERPFAASLSRPTPGPARPTDGGHLEIQEFILQLARRTGRLGSFELPTRPTDPSRSIDIAIRDDRARLLIVAEAWNTFGDLGSAVRASNRKLAEADVLATSLYPQDGDPAIDAPASSPAAPRPRACLVWVVRASRANRDLIAAYPHVFDAAFPGSSRRWVSALERGDEPPAEPGLVWFDASTRRLAARRTRSPTPGA